MAKKPTARQVRKALDAMEVPERFREPTEPPKAPEPPKRGRPSSFKQETADEICRRVAEGENILDICAEPAMPPWTTMWHWQHTHPDFWTAYARARELSAQALEARALRRSTEAKDKDSAAAARVEIDALKWAAAKRDPKRYSDRVDLNHSGQIDTRTVTDEQLDTRIAQLLGKGGAAASIGGTGAATLSTEALELLPGDGRSTS